MMKSTPTSSKRLALIDGHFNNMQSNLTTDKHLITSTLIVDGAKQYPEIIDYHPEKKVSPDNGLQRAIRFLLSNFKQSSISNSSMSID